VRLRIEDVSIAQRKVLAVPAEVATLRPEAAELGGEKPTRRPGKRRERERERGRANERTGERAPDRAPRKQKGKHPRKGSVRGRR
jgi:hypothetical protein